MSNAEKAPSSVGGTTAQAQGADHDEGGTLRNASVDGKSDNPPYDDERIHEKRELEGSRIAAGAIDDYPDGGLRAWMVIVGVSAFLSL
jgi:hypothetical protein